MINRAARKKMNRNRMMENIANAAVAGAAIVAVVAASGSPAAHAQETGVGAGAAAQASGERKSTVIKGRAPVAKDVLAVKLPKAKEFGLDNGAKAYVLEDHRLPTVTFTLSVKAGSLFEDKPGVADMTSALLTEGTTTKSAREIAEIGEDLGGGVGASSGSERASITVTGLSENTDALIALMVDVLKNPAFADDRLKQVEFRAIQGLAQQKGNPAYLAGELSRKIYYGATPYGKLSPNEAQIGAITSDDLKAYHNARYRPAGAVLGVVGDVDPKAVMEKFKTALASWTPGPNPEPQIPVASVAPKEKTAIYLVDRPNSAQTVISWGNIAIKRTDPDYVPLLVMNKILGGGFTSRLNQNLREDKGYTYGANSSFSAGKWPGTLGAGASVRTAVTGPAVGEFVREFARIQAEPVTQTELDQAKRAIIGNFALTLESPAALLGRTLDVADYGLAKDYWDRYPRMIEAVTAGDIQRVARKYIGTGRVQLIAVGEGKEIKTGLEAYGPVTVLTPDQAVAGGE